MTDYKQKGVTYQTPEPKKRLESKPEQTGEQKTGQVNLCDVCGEQPAVIRWNDGKHYCYDHYQVRLTTLNFDRTVELHKKGIDKVVDKIVDKKVKK